MTVIAEDDGDRLIIRPAPDDPIAAASGAFADEVGRVPSEQARRRVRAEEDAREAGRLR